MRLSQLKNYDVIPGFKIADDSPVEYLYNIKSGKLLGLFVQVSRDNYPKKIYIRINPDIDTISEFFPYSYGADEKESVDLIIHNISAKGKFLRKTDPMFGNILTPYYYGYNIEKGILDTAYVNDLEGTLLSVDRVERKLKHKFLPADKHLLNDMCSPSLHGSVQKRIKETNPDYGILYIKVKGNSLVKINLRYEKGNAFREEFFQKILRN